MNFLINQNYFHRVSDEDVIIFAAKSYHSSATKSTATFHEIAKCSESTAFECYRIIFKVIIYFFLSFEHLDFVIFGATVFTWYNGYFGLP